MFLLHFDYSAIKSLLVIQRYDVYSKSVSLYERDSFYFYVKQSPIFPT